MNGTGYAVALLSGVSSAALAAPVAETEVASPVTTVTREMLDSLPAGRSVEDILRTCPARTIPTITAPPRPAPGGKGTTPPDINCVQPADLNVIDIYKAHNQARYEVGSRPLVWDPFLAAQAASYGPQLSLYGRPVHSSRAGRETSRENLLQALPGTSPQAMVGVWIAERQNFINGVFPDVSKTGNWADVGHYSQMVWPTTTNLGCAIHRGGQFDWLICRYSPPGNKDGKMVLAERDKEAPLPPTTGGGLVHPGGAAAPRSAGPGAMAIASTPRLDDILYRCGPKPRAAPFNIVKDATGKDTLVADGGWGAYYRMPDHLPVKADYDGSPAPKAGAQPTPPPESILDDVGEGSAGPPPESILDDVGDGSAARDTPAPLPRTGKGKAVHDTPMAQPREAEAQRVAQKTDAPSAADPAPGGSEARHPLVVYFGQAWSRHDAGICGRDPEAAKDALQDMDRALDELRRRMKDAEQAGEFSSVKPDEVKKVIGALESLRGAAAGRTMPERGPAEDLQDEPPPTN